MSQTQTPKQRNLSYGGSMDPVYRLIVPPFCPVYRCLSGPIGRAHGMMSANSVPFRSSLYENDVHRHVKNNRRRNVTSGHNVRSRHEQCGQGKAGIGEGMIWKSETHLKIMSLFIQFDMLDVERRNIKDLTKRQLWFYFRQWHLDVE